MGDYNEVSARGVLKYELDTRDVRPEVSTTTL